MRAGCEKMRRVRKGAGRGRSRAGQAEQGRRAGGSVEVRSKAPERWRSERAECGRAERRRWTAPLTHEEAMGGTPTSSVLWITSTVSAQPFAATTFRACTAMDVACDGRAAGRGRTVRATFRPRWRRHAESEPGRGGSRGGGVDPASCVALHRAAGLHGVDLLGPRHGRPDGQDARASADIEHHFVLEGAGVAGDGIVVRLHAVGVLEHVRLPDAAWRCGTCCVLGECAPLPPHEHVAHDPPDPRNAQPPLQTVLCGPGGGAPCRRRSSWRSPRLTASRPRL